MSLTPSVLGHSFVDAQFELLSAGLRITPPTLVLGPCFGGQPISLLTADNMLMTVDVTLTSVDADPTLLQAPAVISQTPVPAFPVQPGITVSSIIALGYPVPTTKGFKPVP